MGLARAGVGGTLAHMVEGRRIAAFVYDFDGTLARGNVQEHTFLPELGIDREEFWADVARRAREDDADQILVYMGRMLERARERGVAITREALRRHGARTPVFEGLDTWFERVDGHAASLGIALEHYVVSSGIHEMIEGSPIARRFRRVFASRFLYDDEGRAVWPGLGINYTTKTQFLFRIQKGIENAWDHEAVNRWVPPAARRVPFSRMVFFGDGDTDIPAMRMVREQGGDSIAVFDPELWSARAAQGKIDRLIAENRVSFVAPADYREDTQLEVIAKGLLGRIARA
jgi:phosphoserine phosphatase